MLARRTPADVLRAPARRVAARPLAGTVPAPKTASGGLAPWPRRRVGRTGLQPTVALWKNRPRYDGARRGAVLPQIDQCALALQRSSDTAKIQTYGVTRQAALALGFGGTVGRFVDKSTGATGYFTTSTFLAGVAGGSVAFEGAIYKGGLRNFVGGSDTASIGVTTPIADIGFSSSRNISNGQEIGRGFTFSLKNPFISPMSIGAEATGGFAVTEIFGCKVPK